MRTITCFVLVLVACAPADSEPQRPLQAAPLAIPIAASATDGAAPLFAATEPAPPGSALRVFVDPTRLVGWIAGSKSFAGQTATITISGRDRIATIDSDNTFATDFEVNRTSEATVRVGDLVQRVTVEPPARLEPSAFFIVDRPAYRPGQKLAFTAFLKQEDGETRRPVANTRVEVRIVSATKQTTAAQLAVVSDASGRIAGEYTFSTGDPLDIYSLSIAGYKGTARVTLGEYRKSKVKLDITTAIESKAAMLRFSALDFVDAPVPGGHVSFTAQIVRDPELAAAQLALDTSQFAYPHAFRPLSTDERLWLTANPETASGSLVAAGPQVVSEISGKVPLDGKGTASYPIPLQSDHVRGRHRLLIDAVISDGNGREQRTTRAFPLTRDDVRVELATADELVGTGHPLDVQVRVVDKDGRVVTPASASVAAIRMAPPPQLALYGYGNAYYGNGYGNAYDFENDYLMNNARATASIRGLSCRYTAMGCRYQSRYQRLRARPAPIASSSDTLAATVAVTGNAARLRLDDAGAYRLVASVQLADGTTAWSELGIAVREHEMLPPLVLELDRDEVRQGDRITGRLQGRFRDTAALVVVRDAHGIQSRHRVVLAGGRAQLDLPAGAKLGYGATVEAYTLVGAGEVYAAQEHLRVLPAKQQLAIRTTAKATYGPGETVELDIAVDGGAPVDLVITAYDQALLGVAPDHAVDPSNFYLADDRVRPQAALHALRAELGDVTVGHLLDRARATVKRKLADDASEDERSAVDEANALINLFENTNRLTVHAAVALLRAAGVQASTASYGGWHAPIRNTKALRTTRVIDLLAHELAPLALRRVHDAIMIVDPTQSAATFAARPQLRMYGRGDASGNASFSARPATPVDAPVVPVLQVSDGDGNDVVRRDFSDSAYWSATTRTDATGKARVSFKLPDSLTTWQVVVTAVGSDTRVGRHVTRLRTIRDVMIWPMLPRQFTEGDVISVAGTVHNLTDVEREITVALKTERVDVLSPATVSVRVRPGKGHQVSWSVRANERGLARLLMSATARTGAGADASEKLIPIVASAAEQVVTASGFADKPLVVELPDGVSPAQATLEITFAPSLAADLVDTIGYLVEYPYGCAEQTMSRFAPAIKVAGILDNLGIEDGPLRAKLPGVVDAGMKRLTELQQPDGGWGWHGSGATHEMITPYVVWGLIEAEKAGYKSPSSTTIARGLERVRAFAEALRDDAQLSDRTYLMYVYSQRHRVPDAWWTELVGKRAQLSDYALALALEIALARKDADNSAVLATALEQRAQRGGGHAHWKTAGFTRWGEDPFETSAAALKALVAYNVNAPIVAESLAHFVATKRGDRWNSTKDTAMILYAMTDLLGRKGVKAGTTASVDYTIDNGAPTHLGFSDGRARKVVVEGAKLRKRTTIAFVKATPGMMARAVLRYHESGRNLTAASYGLDVKRELFLLDTKGARARQLASGDRVPRGTYVESVVTVTHAANQRMRFMLVEDPKPAGAEALPLDDPRFPRVPTPWVLREDREGHLAFHHEEVPATTATRTYLHLEMPGELALAPAQAELMYQTATRGHSGSFVLRVD